MATTATVQNPMADWLNKNGLLATAGAQPTGQPQTLKDAAGNWISNATGVYSGNRPDQTYQPPPTPKPVDPNKPVTGNINNPVSNWLNNNGLLANADGTTGQSQVKDALGNWISNASGVVSQNGTPALAPTTPDQPPVVATPAKADGGAGLWQTYQKNLANGMNKDVAFKTYTDSVQAYQNQGAPPVKTETIKTTNEKGQMAPASGYGDTAEYKFNAAVKDWHASGADPATKPTRSQFGLAEKERSQGQIDRDETLSQVAGLTYNDLKAKTEGGGQTSATTQPTGQSTPTTNNVSNFMVNPDESQSVEGRLSGLLNSNSDYMNIAKNAGLQSANARGLGNSSMAAQASQKAAINAALPIAAQDASAYQQYLNTAQQGNIQTSLQKQKAADDLIQSAADYDEQARLYMLEGDINSALYAQKAADDMRLAAQNAEAQAKLSEQEYGQSYQLEGLKGNQALALQAAASEQKAGLLGIEGEQARLTQGLVGEQNLEQIGAKGVQDRLAQEIAGYQNRLTQAEQAGWTAQQSEQDTQEAIQLEGVKNMNTLKQLEVEYGTKLNLQTANNLFLEADTAARIAADKYASDNTAKTNFLVSVERIRTVYTNGLQEILRNKDMDDASKEVAVKQIVETTRASLSDLGVISGFPIDWVVADPDLTKETVTPNVWGDDTVYNGRQTYGD